MKKINRAVSLLLVLCTVLSVLPVAVAASSMPFSDVNRADWFYKAVEYVYEEGLMSGTGETTFSPHGTTTRGMIVEILYRLEGKPLTYGENFADVAQNAYYADAVAWANDRGIVTGYGNGCFGPNDAVTRQQLAAILFRYAGFYEKNTVPRALLGEFRDADSVADYAVDAMQWAVATDLIKGSDGYLSPTGLATRAQVATILERFSNDGGSSVLPGFLFNTDDEDDDKENDDKENDDGEKITYTVTFEGNVEDTGTYQVQQVNVGETVKQPDVPVYVGYVFKGWSLDAVDEKWYDFSEDVTEDVTLYAHWMTLDETPEQEIDGAVEVDSTVYGISDLIMEGQNATVIVNTVGACKMILNFYDEKTGELIGTAQADITDNVSMEPVSVVVEDALPEYYEVEVRLIDNKRAELCGAYRCKEYTRGYAEFMALTPADFDEDRVVYFTDARTEDFGVLADDVICVETSDFSNTLTAFDMTYIFTNIDDTVRKLKADDQVAVLQNGKILANIEIENIDIKGSEATIVAKEITLGEFYKIANVEIGTDGENVPQVFALRETEEGDENTVIKGRVEKSIEAQLAKIYSIEVDFTTDVTICIDLKVCEFMQVEKFELEVVLDTTATYDVGVTGEKKLANMAQMKAEDGELFDIEVEFKTPIAFLTVPVEFSAPVELAATGCVSATDVSTSVKGFRYENSVVQEWESSTHDIKGSVKGRVEFKVGMKGKIGVEAFQVLKAGVYLEIGMGIVTLGEYSFGGGNTEDSYHACTCCVDGKLIAYGVFGAYLEAGEEFVVIELELKSVEQEIDVFYVSLINDERSAFKGKIHFGMGKCPNKIWRTDIYVLQVNEPGMIKVYDNNDVLVAEGEAPLRAYLYDGEYVAKEETTSAEPIASYASHAFVMWGSDGVTLNNAEERPFVVDKAAVEVAMSRDIIENVYEAYVNGEEAIVAADAYSAYIINLQLRRSGVLLPASFKTSLVLIGRSVTGLPVWRIRVRVSPDDEVVTNEATPQFRVEDNCLAWYEGAPFAEMQQVKLDEDAKFIVVRRRPVDDSVFLRYELVTDVIQPSEFNDYMEKYECNPIRGYSWLKDRIDVNGYIDGYYDWFYLVVTGS